MKQGREKNLGNAERELAGAWPKIFRGRANGFACYTRGSIGSRRRAASCTVRASGPTQSRRGESGITPSTLTRPRVRLEADDAAERSRNADGAASVGADAAIAEAGGDGGSGATAGTAGNAREIPGIVDGAVVRVVAGDAVGELVHVGFADDDGACILELADDCGIFRGNEILQNF